MPETEHDDVRAAQRRQLLDWLKARGKYTPISAEEAESWMPRATFVRFGRPKAQPDARFCDAVHARVDVLPQHLVEQVKKARRQIPREWDNAIQDIVVRQMTLREAAIAAGLSIKQKDLTEMAARVELGLSALVELLWDEAGHMRAVDGGD